MALDAVLSSYDSQVVDLTAQIKKYQGQYNYYTGDRKTLIQSLIQTLYTHNGTNYSIYYNKLQDFNKVYFDQEPVYENQTFPEWLPEDFYHGVQAWTNLIKEDQAIADGLKIKLIDLSAQLETITINRNRYLNNLPTITADEIKTQAALSNKSLASDIAQKEADAKLAQDKLKSDIFAKKNTMYIVIAVIAVAVIFTSAIVYKKFFK